VRKRAELSGARSAAARAAAAGTFAMPRTVRTPRLTLAPLGSHLTEDFVRFFADEDASFYVGGPADAAGAWKRLAMFAGQWSLHGFGHYALHDAEGEFVGFAGLWFPADWPEIEIGYALVPEARGLGYASEAVRAIHALAMELGAPALVSYIHPQNETSKQVACAVGAVEEGTIDLSGKTACVFRYPMHDVGAVPALDEDAAGASWEASAMPLNIRTSRLVLTQWRTDHYEPSVDHFADADDTRYTGGVLTATQVWRGIAAAAGQWLLRGYGVYAVEMDGRFVGGVGLSRPLGWPEIELVWTLMREVRGQGFATEAARAVRDVAAEQGMRRLASFIHPENAPSIAVAERLGARPDGTVMLEGGESLVFRHRMDVAEASGAAAAAPH
jgi:RimJ/RimL family protein N-acetyltransferase